MASKKTGERLAKIAAKVLAGKRATQAEMRSLAASVLAQKEKR